MARNMLTILLIVGIFGICAPENMKTLLDIEKLLSSIHMQDTPEHRDLELGQRDYNRPSHYRHGYRYEHHKTDTPNLMNIQTMNLYMKPRKQRYNLDNILRMDTDRMCRETGRCGCTGPRCGDMTNREDEVANEVDKIVDELNEQLQRKDVNTNEKDSDNSNDHELPKKLRCDGDRCEYERYSVDYDGRPDYDHTNDVDIYILDMPKGSKEEIKFLDLTRNNLHLDLNEAPKKQESYNLEFNQNGKAKDQSNEGAPTPDEFVSHYETVKKNIIKKLKHYIQNNTPIPLKHLHDTQKQLLTALKMKYNNGRLTEDELTSEIVRIIFGEHSGAKIYPHNENNDNIYISRWHYNSLLKFKRDLRSQKRILPLTTQQRGRLINRETKTIPKLAWRKSLNQQIQRFGVPFDLEVHGLGQLNS